MSAGAGGQSDIVIQWFAACMGRGEMHKKFMLDNLKGRITRKTEEYVGQ
jgi:hypothetical protein